MDRGLVGWVSPHQHLLPSIDSLLHFRRGTTFSTAGSVAHYRVSMRKPISPRIHGVLDYATAATVAAAPRAMHFPKPARVLFESLAAGYTGVSAVTDYPLSVKRLVPFKAH